MAIKKDFIPKKNLDTFSLHTSLYTHDKLVDQSVVEYDCADIDPTKCLSAEEELYDTSDTNTIFISILILILLV